ncbi:hypothetical protein Prudu_011434 [Prunus dulcis]|uniref:Uncharacterized protein n=1 Tax=Prunus dulcis TaxID=3755 RepID=A0A4Y1RAK9_PRUDU|nr:hypothetical protein Prudu_011434 [Prunus dulcis]
MDDCYYHLHHHTVSSFKSCYAMRARFAGEYYGVTIDWDCSKTTESLIRGSCNWFVGQIPLFSILEDNLPWFDMHSV